MKQKTIIKAEQGTLLVTLMRNEDEDGYELCKEPVIAWCIKIDEDNYTEVTPLTVDGDESCDGVWAIQYPYSAENSFKHRVPFYSSFSDDKELFADLIDMDERNRKSRERRMNEELSKRKENGTIHGNGSDR